MKSTQATPVHAERSEFSEQCVYLDRDSVRLRRVDYFARLVQSPHHHDFASVTLVLRGDCQERSEHDTHVSQSCTVLIKPPHVSHSNEYGERGTVSLQIAFSPRAFPSFPSGRACRHLEGGAPVARMLALLRATAHARDAALVPLIKDAMNAVADACLDKTQTEAPDWMDEICRDIKGEPADRVSVQHLARQIGMHPVSMARAFRRHHACSISEYIRRTRIVRASRRIAAGDASLADVAVEAGFADQPHFTRAFRAELACTPGEFRRMIV